MSSEVGSGHIAFIPTFKGFRKAILGEVDGSAQEAAKGFGKRFASTGTETGKKTGQGFKNAFASSSKGTGDAAVKALTDSVAKASRAVSTARLREQDAAGKVRVAEAQLAEARSKYAADSSQVIRAEERLASTLSRLEVAKQSTKTATDGLSSAQQGLAAATAQADAAASRAAGGIRGSFSSLGELGSRTGSAIASGFESAMNGVRRIASGAVDAIKATLAAVATAIGAVAIKAVGLAKDAFFAAARVEELDVALQAVAKASGVVYEDLVAATKAVRANGIELAASQRFVLKFTQANLQLADASKVARVAQDLAVISGQNSTETAENLLQAITSQSTIMLRNAGIVQSASEGYDKYAKSIGKIAADLTDMEKKQAIVNLILDVGADVAGTYEASMTSVGKVIRSFPRLFNDIGVGFGGIFTAGLGPLTLGLYDVTKGFASAVSEGGVLEPLIGRLRDRFVELLRPVTETVTAFSKNVGPNIERMIGFFSGLGEKASELKGILGPLGGVLVALASGGIAAVLSKLPLIGGLAKPFALLGGPIGIVVAALAGLVAVSPRLQAVFSVAFQRIVESFGVAFSKLSPVLDSLVPILLKLSQSVAGALADALMMLLPFVVQLIDLFGELLAQVLPPLVPVFMAIVTAVLKLVQALLPLVETVLTALMPVLATLLAELAPLFVTLLEAIVPLLDPLLKLLMPLTDLVALILPPLIALLGWLIENAMEPLKVAIGMLIPIITALVNAFSNYLMPIIDAVTKVLDGLITFIVGVFTGNWEQAWEGMLTIFAGVWDTIQAVAKGAVNFIIDLINGVIGALNFLTSGLSDLTGGGISVTIPTIPKLATGTNYAPEAFIAGEKGPELITGMRGATVRPYEATKDILARRGETTIQVFPSAKASEEEIARETVRELEWVS